MPELFNIQQTDVHKALRRVQVGEDFINERAPQTSVPEGQIFEGHQPFEMDADLR
jgi:hypothetical protein